MIRLGQLPVTLKVGKKEWKIRTDYRDILVIMQAFNDPELTVEEAHVVMCKILYEGWTDMPKELYEEAAKKALWFLDCGQEDEEDIMPVKVMDWEQDEPILFPASFFSLSMRNFLTPITVHNIADKSWLSTVAQAAPATPILNGTINTTSRTMFKREENTRKTRGVRLSPNARRILDIML